MYRYLIELEIMNGFIQDKKEEKKKMMSSLMLEKGVEKERIDDTFAREL